MLALDRRREILRIVEEYGSVKVQNLSEKFDVTEETIRRDLDKLERKGYIKRTYGGAIFNENIKSDVPFDVRQIKNIDEKQSIAEVVINYINDGDTIMLDSSSTTLQLAKLLKRKENITVITNSVPIILELANNDDIKVISTGGDLRKSSLSFIGSSAVQSLKKYNVNKSIMSCKAFVKEKGVMESSEQEGIIKKTMTELSDEVYLLVDGTKVDNTAFYNMFDFEDIDILFTDLKLSKEWENFLEEKDVDYKICQ